MSSLAPKNSEMMLIALIFRNKHALYTTILIR